MVPRKYERREATMLRSMAEKFLLEHCQFPAFTEDLKTLIFRVASENSCDLTDDPVIRAVWDLCHYEFDKLNKVSVSDASDKPAIDADDDLTQDGQEKKIVPTFRVRFNTRKSSKR